MAGFSSKFKNLWSVPEELEDEERPSRRSRNKDYKSDRRSSEDDYSKSYSNRYSDDLEDDYYESSYSDSSLYRYSNYSDDEYYDTSSSYSSGLSNSYYSNKILNINATARLQVVFFKPLSFNNDAVLIADELMKSHTVLLNFEETPRDESKRIVDFLSGCAYVSGGKVQRIAKNIFIITPNNVELTGDSLIDELQSNGLQITE